MKTLLRIEKPAPKQYPFQHSDLGRAIFLGKAPIFVDRPFASLHPSVLAKLPVHYNVGLFDDEEETVWHTLHRTVQKVGKRTVSSRDLFLKLPEWAINMMAEAYFTHAGNWREYLYAEIEKFCLTQQSKMQWELFKRIGIQNVLLQPQSGSLTTRIPSGFPAPYRGKDVSIYLGPAPELPPVFVAFSTCALICADEIEQRRLRGL